MSPDTKQDWNPGAYARFRGLRIRPAMDLLAQVGTLPDGDLVDLGCGSGAVASSLAARFSGRDMIGVDSSPAMLSAAAATGQYTRLIEADVAGWAPERPPALIYSNAVCHWVGDHEALFRRLAGALVPGGTLAVQMPRQFDAPSHALLREIAGQMFPDRFDYSAWLPPVGSPEDYARMFLGLGVVNAWETVYVQRLEPARAAHPVRRFTEATAMRPFVAELSEEEAGQFVSAYEAELAAAYPVEEDGSVFFPIRRLFFTLTPS